MYLLMCARARLRVCARMSEPSIVCGERTPSAKLFDIEAGQITYTTAPARAHLAINFRSGECVSVQRTSAPIWRTLCVLVRVSAITEDKAAIGADATDVQRDAAVVAITYTFQYAAC